MSTGKPLQFAQRCMLLQNIAFMHRYLKKLVFGQVELVNLLGQAPDEERKESEADESYIFNHCQEQLAELMTKLGCSLISQVYAEINDALDASLAEYNPMSPFTVFFAKGKMDVKS